MNNEMLLLIEKHADTLIENKKKHVLKKPLNSK